MCTVCTPGSLRGQKRGSHTSLGTEVKRGCEPSRRCWESNLSCLQEQQMTLTFLSHLPSSSSASLFFSNFQNFEKVPLQHNRKLMLFGTMMILDLEVVVLFSGEVSHSWKAKYLMGLSQQGRQSRYLLPRFCICESTSVK